MSKLNMWCSGWSSCAALDAIFANRPLLAVFFLAGAVLNYYVATKK